MNWIRLRIMVKCVTVCYFLVSCWLIMLSLIVVIHWGLWDVRLCFVIFGFGSILSVILDSFNVWLLLMGLYLWQYIFMKLLANSFSMILLLFLRLYDCLRMKLLFLQFYQICSWVVWSISIIKVEVIRMHLHWFIHVI